MIAISGMKSATTMKPTTTAMTIKSAGSISLNSASIRRSTCDLVGVGDA